MNYNCKKITLHLFGFLLFGLNAQESKYMQWQEGITFYSLTKDNQLIAKDKDSYFPSPNTVVQLNKNHNFADKMFLLCGTPTYILREYSGTWRIVNDTLFLTQ